RVDRLQRLVEELTSQRAEERLGEVVEVLVDGPDNEGRAAHQAPEVDGTTTLSGPPLPVGALVRAMVTGSGGVDLLARPL
ncbi:MAG: hypothetical protein H7233_02090, partial [Pseudorhodobacter sp.]|nr:hypothetical protein [Frankiaceae bacterium]